jgi:uncharacterized membrane protein YphA (DoxX/SURF4 family)
LAWHPNRFRQAIADLLLLIPIASRAVIIHMNGLPLKVFLVLLRLAIGWHFLFEGLEKLHSWIPEKPAKPPRSMNTRYGWPVGHPVRVVPDRKAPKPKKAWTSEAYLRGANGPAAELFHWIAGDRLMAKLDVRGDEGDKPPERFPLALEKDWKGYFDAFVAYYDVNDEQLERLKTVFEQRKAGTVEWLLHGTRKVAKTPVAGNATIEVEMTTPERIQEYQDKMDRLEDLQSGDSSSDFRPDLNTELELLQADASRLRSELQKDIHEQTAEMKAGLYEVLFVEPHRPDFGALAIALGTPSGYKLWEQSLSMIPRPESPDLMPEPIWHSVSDWDQLDWVDWLTAWGVTVVGGLLLAGFFTRTACVGGALFLLMFFLAMPPFPWLPANPRAEGHYLYINKNIIEMLALLALACTPSGRWVGLDGFIH